MENIEKTLERLQYILDRAPALLLEIGEREMSVKASPEKWSKKEILGHLLDSATNNHQRFVRGQFEMNPEIRYDQNKWVEHSFYQNIESQQIIQFWTSYNKQLLEIMKRIPNEQLKKQIRIGDQLKTIEFLMVDYLEHLEHHLKQIIAY